MISGMGTTVWLANYLTQCPNGGGNLAGGDTSPVVADANRDDANSSGGNRRRGRTAGSMAASQIAQQGAMNQLATFNGQMKSKDDVPYNTSS